MNYLRSLEYIEAKNQLRGEYKEAIIAIESFYIRIYTDERYEVQYSLKKVLNDFLSAQEAGRSISAVVGPDIKEYAINIIGTELKPKKDFAYRLTYIIFFIWSLLIMMFAQVILSDTYKGDGFIDKMRHMSFNIYFVIGFLLLVICGCLLTIIRKGLSKRLFYRLGLLKLIHIAYVLSIILLAACYIKLTSHYGNELSFHMPLSLYLILFITTTAYILAASFISGRKTEAKKRDLITHEEDTIEQVACPSCGHVHDIDYPKCPNCGLLSTHR